MLPPNMETTLANPEYDYSDDDPILSVYDNLNAKHFVTPLNDEKNKDSFSNHVATYFVNNFKPLFYF